MIPLTCVERGSKGVGAGAGGAAGEAPVSLLGHWGHGPVNILKATELHTLDEWIVRHVNYISIKNTKVKTGWGLQRPPCRGSKF